MIMPRLLHFRIGLGYGSISFPIKLRLFPPSFFAPAGTFLLRTQEFAQSSMDSFGFKAFYGVQWSLWSSGALAGS